MDVLHRHQFCGQESDEIFGPANAARQREQEQMTQERRHIFETHERIKCELRLRGTSLARIARELGVSNTSMTLVGLGKHRSRRIEAAIARALETTPERLWPDRYQTKQAKGDEP